MEELNSELFNQLDEIVQKGYKDHSIGFANWLLINCYIDYDHSANTQRFGFKKDEKSGTTEQLYQMYLDSL